MSDYSYIYIDWNFRIVEACLSCFFFREDGWHFAECKELKFLDQGETKNEALRNLSNMINAMLLDAISTGKIEKILKELGFKKEKIQIPNRDYYKIQIKLDKKTILLPVKAYFPVLAGAVVKTG